MATLMETAIAAAKATVWWLRYQMQPNRRQEENLIGWTQ